MSRFGRFALVFTIIWLWLILILGSALARSQTIGGPLAGCTGTVSTGTGWTSSTTINTAQVLANNITATALLVTLDQGSTITGGVVQFLGNPGDGNYVALASYQVLDPTSTPFSQIGASYTLAQSTNKQFLIYTYGMSSIELKLTTVISGTGTVTPFTTPFCGNNAQIWNQLADNIAQINGNTVSTAATGVQKVGVVGNGGAAFDQAPGSAIPANAVQQGVSDGTNTRVPYYDPCGFQAWTYFPINVSANTQIVAGSASKNVYVCEMFLAPAAAAANVDIVESATSGNACATSPTGMMGGATAALGAQLSANGGFVLDPSPSRAWMKTATSGDAMCIFASAQVTGVLAYVQF